MDDPLPADGLILWPRACEGPLPGRFVATGRSCEGHPVWRWEGEAPGGGVHLVQGWPPMVSAALQVEGAPRGCPPPARVAGEPLQPEAPQETVRPTSLARSSLSVVPDGGGGQTLRWDRHRSVHPPTARHCRHLKRTTPC